MMETTSPIRGNFDHLVFFKENFNIGLNDRYFAPLLEGKWVLILENQFNATGALRSESDYTQELLNENPFFNSETLFKVYDHRYGSFCIGWQQGNPPIIGEELYSTNLVTRLQDIVAATNFPPDAVTLRQQVEDALFDCYLGVYKKDSDEVVE